MIKKRIFSVVANELKNDNRVFNQAFSLSNAGYDVTLLGIQRKTSLPIEEHLNGVKIIRQRMGNKNLEKIKYLRALCFIPLVLIQIFKQARNHFDYVHCHDLNTLQYGFFIKLFNLGKIELIYDAHEYETQRNGLHGIKWTYVKLKERFLIRFCDRVITVSDTIADEYARLYSIEKPTVVLNCPILRTENVIKKNLFRENLGIAASKKIFLYQGYLSPGRGIEVILEAFDQLNLENAVLIFMGEGMLTELISEHKKFGKSVYIHPFVTGEVLLDYTSSADCGIAFIEDISLSDRYCLPNKLFEYIAAGLPVISSCLPDMKHFINRYNVGTSSTTNDANGLIDAFNNLPNLDSPELEKHIENTRALFNWGTQEKILLDLYKSFGNNECS